MSITIKEWMKELRHVDTFPPIYGGNAYSYPILGKGSFSNATITIMFQIIPWDSVTDSMLASTSQEITW